MDSPDSGETRSPAALGAASDGLHASCPLFSSHPGRATGCLQLVVSSRRWNSWSGSHLRSPCASSGIPGPPSHADTQACAWAAVRCACGMRAAVDWECEDLGPHSRVLRPGLLSYLGRVIFFLPTSVSPCKMIIRSRQLWSSLSRLHIPYIWVRLGRFIEIPNPLENTC